MKQTQEILEWRYEPTPTAYKFHNSRARVRCLMGPMGTGKTTACIWEMLLRAAEMPAYYGVRESRWAVIRNTYPELETTTLKTFLNWIPQQFLKLRKSVPITAEVKFRLHDTTLVSLEVVFLALDEEKDIRKLLSNEFTCAWINEAREVNRAVLDMLTGRLPRFPRKMPNTTFWHGVIMDTNPPDVDHWLYRLFEEERPMGYEMFKYPPALVQQNGMWAPNPQAENLNNLPTGANYYLDMLPGKSKDWISVYILGEYGTTMDGKPVYPEYRDELHCAKQPLQPYRSTGIIVGMDFGLTPSAVICQLTPRGRFLVLDECIGTDIGTEKFVRNLLKPLIAAKYSGLPCVVIGDPAGNTRAQTDEATCYDILRREGFHVEAAPTNEILPRREAVARFLSYMIEGDPAFIMSPSCNMLRRGFLGKYVFERVYSRGQTTYKDQPCKNEYSHVHDALQYAALSVNFQLTRFSDSFNGGVEQTKKPVRKADYKFAI